MNIDEEKLAEKLANDWFFEEYESKLHPKELYEEELVEGHGLILNRYVKDEYARLYFSKLEEYKRIISLFEVD